MLNKIQLQRIDLNLLVLFDAVMAEVHVGRAATRLNLSASAVSHGLGRLRRLLNDPLFLRTPKGVVPTARAIELAEPIADILARARSVIATARPFDPATSTRRFIIGAIDGIATAVLPPLLAAVRRTAPGIDISLRQLRVGMAIAELEARNVDLAITPADAIPARFEARPLYEDNFVVVTRAGHPFARRPTLANYCRMLHVVVSLGNDERTMLDGALAEKGLTRRVALFVPSFLQALTVVAESDLIAAVPRRLAIAEAKRFGLAIAGMPLRLPASVIRAVVPKVALMDAGLAWLFDAVEMSTRQGGAARKSPARRS
jgi:DNA-binding transcriptional LysR family regulator